MTEFDFSREDIVIPATSGARVFENNAGTITITSDNEESDLLVFTVAEARMVAAALIQKAEAIEEANRVLDSLQRRPCGNS